MARMARERERREIERQTVAERREADLVRHAGAIFLPENTIAMLRALLDRVPTAPMFEGSELIAALQEVLERDPTPGEVSAYHDWSRRLTGRITLPERDGLPF